MDNSWTDELAKAGFPPPPDIDPLPKVVKSRDWELFAKEAKLAGWEVLRLSRNKKAVIVEKWVCFYRRTRKNWICEGWAGIKSPSSLRGYTSFREMEDYFRRMRVGIGNYTRKPNFSSAPPRAPFSMGVKVKKV